MAENEIFISQLKEGLNQKTEWFNSIRLQELLVQYRILQSCTKNLYDALIKKSLIIPDPYRLDKKIQDITVPETSSFTDNEASSVLGTRFSEYELMLDYICTYIRFAVENLPIPKIKKLIELNKVFDWENLSPSNTKSNTHALAEAISQAKTNTQSVIISMITDCVEKNAEATIRINRILNELGTFQKELYKAELRKDLFEHPEFNKDKAYVSEDAELAEIKRLYTKVMGKKPFYSDLVKEIIQEDLAPNKEMLREDVLRKLSIPKAAPVAKKKSTGPNFKEMIMSAVMAVAAMAPTIQQLKAKLANNFELVFKKDKNFMAKLAAALRKAFHLKEPIQICTIKVEDQRTGSAHNEKIIVNEFMNEVVKKERIYGSIAVKGPEYEKIDAASEDAILAFVNKQISEVQTLFTKMNALDAFFKSAVDSEYSSKIKGMQIELSALRNSIINANKKRGEYSAAVEEAEQMKRLGITKYDE